MKNYYEKQTIKDFSSTKEYWNKHKSTVVLKSDKSSSSQPTMLLLDDIEISDNLAIANAFNGFLTNIASYSEENHDSCINYINNSFDNLDRDSEKFIYNNFKILKNQHNLQTNEFDFNHLTLEDVIKAFKEIQVKSSPGSSKIPTKILKNSIDAIGPVLVDLFNTCIVTNKIPSKFKFAVCLPLLKKGSTKDMNNYRCISILPPIAKLLEKLLAKQIRDYFGNNKLFYAGQHGFRTGFSCESALHELISDINLNQDKKLITMLLFIDFRKAFDLVDSKLLLKKLFHYGFNNNALKRMKNYFMNRKQIIRIK
jgi:hypothetical protein